MLCSENMGFHTRRFQFVLRIGSLFVCLRVISGADATEKLVKAKLNAEQAKFLFGLKDTPGSDDLAKLNTKHEKMLSSFKDACPGYTVSLGKIHGRPKVLSDAVTGWMSPFKKGDVVKSLKPLTNKENTHNVPVGYQGKVRKVKSDGKIEVLFFSKDGCQRGTKTFKKGDRVKAIAKLKTAASRKVAAGVSGEVNEVKSDGMIEVHFYGTQTPTLAKADQIALTHVEFVVGADQIERLWRERGERILIENHWRPYVHRMLARETRETAGYKRKLRIDDEARKLQIAKDSKLVNEFISFWGDLVNLIQDLYQDWSKCSNRAHATFMGVNGDRFQMDNEVSYIESIKRQNLVHLLENIPEIDLGDGQITAIKTRVFAEMDQGEFKPKQMVKALVSLCIGLGALSSISAPGFTMFSSALGGSRTGFWDSYHALKEHRQERQNDDRAVIDEYYNQFMKTTNQLMWIQTRLEANSAKGLFPKERVAMKNFKNAMQSFVKPDDVPDEKAMILAHEYVSWPTTNTPSRLELLSEKVKEQKTQLDDLEKMVSEMKQRHENAIQVMTRAQQNGALQTSRVLPGGS